MRMQKSIKLKRTNLLGKYCLSTCPKKMKISLWMMFIGVDFQFGVPVCKFFKTSINNPLQQKEEMKSLLRLKTFLLMHVPPNTDKVADSESPFYDHCAECSTYLFGSKKFVHNQSVHVYKHTSVRSSESSDTVA